MPGQWSRIILGRRVHCACSCLLRCATHYFAVQRRVHSSGSGECSASIQRDGPGQQPPCSRSTIPRLLRAAPRSPVQPRATVQAVG